MRAAVLVVYRASDSFPTDQHAEASASISRLEFVLNSREYNSNQLPFVLLFQFRHVCSTRGIVYVSKAGSSFVAVPQHIAESLWLSGTHPDLNLCLRLRLKHSEAQPQRINQT
jgi:hypothetical protein